MFDPTHRGHYFKLRQEQDSLFKGTTILKRTLKSANEYHEESKAQKQKILDGEDEETNALWDIFEGLAITSIDKAKEKGDFKSSVNVSQMVKGKDLKILIHELANRFCNRLKKLGFECEVEGGLNSSFPNVYVTMNWENPPVKISAPTNVQHFEFGRSSSLFSPSPSQPTAKLF